MILVVLLEVYCSRKREGGAFRRRRMWALILLLRYIAGPLLWLYTYNDGVGLGKTLSKRYRADKGERPTSPGRRDKRQKCQRERVFAHTWQPNSLEKLPRRGRAGVWEALFFFAVIGHTLPLLRSDRSAIPVYNYRACQPPAVAYHTATMNSAGRPKKCKRTGHFAAG